MAKIEAEVPKNGTSGSANKRDTTYTQITDTQSSIGQRSGLPERSLVFDDPTIGKGFVQVPRVVLMDKRLSSNDKILYALLLMYAWQDGECFPGQERLGDDMDCNRKTLMSCMKHLVSVKLVKVNRRGLGKSNVYHIRRLSDAYTTGFHDRG